MARPPMAAISRSHVTPRPKNDSFQALFYRFRFKVLMVFLIGWFGGMAVWRSSRDSGDEVVDWSALRSSAVLTAIGTGTASLEAPQTTQTKGTGGNKSFKEWRRRMSDLCASAVTREEVFELGEKMKRGFVMPSSRVEQPRNEKAVVPCKLVVMDFGANCGDTAGHAIDAGLFGCKRNDLHVEGSDPHFNLESKVVEDPERNRRNPITRWLADIMKNIGKTIGPEDYCYYGVEGNPVFTKRLQELEDFIMGMKPQPLKHLHFFTESVGAGEDGPTKLWLDTVNADQNFWGSSLFKGHADVVKSAKEKNTTEVAADVMGYTIGTLMKKTLAAFDPNAPEEDRKGGHLLLKVDIEGGEYPLLVEAAQDKTLCDFIQMGNNADLFVEFHSQRVTGRNPLVWRKKDAQKTLEDCGVKFRNLQAWWS